MKFALVNGERREARNGLVGTCIGCGRPMLAKCGFVRSHHWAHKSLEQCDSWWEPETEWHRNWKNQFPEEWQEIPHISADGEKHIADVKTKEGWVLEFQHSHIAPDERKSRENFYKKIVWVVDGSRTTQIKNRFLLALESGGTHRQFPELKTIFSSKLALLKTWAPSKSHVVFDFGSVHLWWLWSTGDEAWSYLVAIPRTQFVCLFLEPQATDINAFFIKYDQVLSQRGAFPSLSDYYFFKDPNQ